MDRRSFLFGSMTGLGVIALAGCAPDAPPRPEPTASPEPDPPAVSLLRSTWSTDDFARGATSFLAVGTAPALRDALAAPVGDRLFFAGEATSGIRPGTLRGAQASGERVAQELLDAAEIGERVIVVGAGLAGATAARRLTAAGLDVQVVEARDRTGGRILTVEDEDWAVRPELGALRVRGSDTNPIVDRLTDLEIELDPIDADSVDIRSLDGESIAADGSGRSRVEEALAAAADGLRDVSLGEALETRGTAVEGAVESYLDASVTGVLGSEPAELSSWYGASELDEGEDQLAVGGLSALVDAALDGIDVALGSPVTRIGYGEDGVSMRFSSGESLRADRVVLTVPLGVLKGQGIDFAPALPFEKRAAIDGLGLGQVETVWLRFEGPRWSTEAERFSIVGDGVAVPEWINLQALIGEPILVGTVGGDAAVAFAELDDDAAREAALASLAPFLDLDEAPSPTPTPEP